jgi:acyl transferase domain-containing protein/thioesterase domain-containing protein
VKDTIRHTDVAIIGMAGRFPGAKNVDEFWRNIRDGVESVVFFSEEELLNSGVLPAVLRQPNYIPARAALDDIELFDASFFGFNPKEAEIMDPQHRFFLECAWEALEHAGYDSEQYPGPIGVYAGVSMSTYLIGLYANREVAATAGSMQIRLGNDKDYLPTRVSYKLNLRGPSVNVQTACSTSLVAVQMAYQSLLNYQCDIALAGGVSIAVPQREGYSYREGGVGSRDGHCRAFDASADGTIGGSGVGIVVLKRLADALDDGDCIHAVIRGAGINNDGSLKVGYTAPSVDGQAEVIAMAQSVADVNPESIGYIEAHGTGTALGDPIEIAALNKAFRAGTKKKNFCGIGSVKTNIGHLDAAAGAAGLIKTVMALKHKMLPPSLNFEQPNPKINFDDSPFFVSTKLANWQLPAGQDRRVAGVSAFGIGGTNVHLIVEEAPEISTTASDSSPWQLLVLSAKTETALQRRISSLATHLQEHPELNLADVAHTLRVGRRAFEHRAVLACRDSADAVKALDSMDHQRILTGRAKEQNQPVVFMFPGGGAQHVNMGRELYDAEPVFRNEVDNCAELLKTSLKADLRDLLYPVEEKTESASKRLRETSVALPALFTIEYALAKLWMSWGIKPHAMIGHSLGEYVAACLSGVISLKDALSMVALRGQLFETLPRGAMLSVPLSEAELSPLMNGKLSIAAINGASQCVVSGESEAIDRFATALNEREIETRRLHIDVAAHSQTVEPILDEFTTFVKRLRFRKPSIPYVSNVTGDWIAADEITPNYWRTHLRHTVRFADGLRQLSKMSPIFLEVGPGQVLTALAQGAAVNGQGKRILSSCRHPLDQQSDQGFLLNTLGRLWLAGVQIDWTAFGRGQQRRRVPLPTYPFERHKYWIEPPRRGQVVNTNNVLRRKPDVADWFYLPSWKRTTQTYSLNGDAAEPENFLIFSDQCGLGAKLARRLEEMGHQVVSVEAGTEFSKRSPARYAINPREASDYNTLVDELVASHQLPQRVVHLWSVTPDDSSDLFHGFYSLVFLLQAAGRRAASEKDTLQIDVVSNNMQEVNGDEHVIPEKIMVLGPVRVMSQEYPNVVCRSIDIESESDHRMEQLIGELFATPMDQVVAYRGNHRWTQSFEPVRIKGSTTVLRDKGVYVITGGLGNVGLVIAEWIAEHARGAKLALLGRSTQPSKSKVGKLEELGAEIMTLSADVGDEQQMRAAFAEVERRFGAINGVIHAAGTVGSHSVAPLGELSIASCEKQFHPKVQGVYVLERILRDKKIEFCLLTSSLASVLGGLRLGAYAAANLFMDSFVNQYRRTSSVPWISLNWDAWLFDREKTSAGGNAMAEFAITPPEGKAIMDKALSTPIHAQLIVSTADLNARFKQWVNRVVAKEQKEKDQTEHDATPLHPRPGLANEYVEPQTTTQQTIADIWKELLGIEQVGIHDNFFELGGHSLIGIHFIARLRQVFKVSGLHLNTLFESPTVAGISKTIDEATGIESKAASTSPLVLMQPEGTRPPIFFIHPIGGHVFRFVNLVKHLGNDHPFYGLQARGLAELASEGQHHQTIEEMAAEYISAIQEVQPKGPYFIGGWSFGGFVAFEVAQQLRAKGETMGLLAIIDAPSPGNFVKITSIDDTALLLELARQRGHKAGKNGFVSARDLKGLTADEQFDYILNRMKEASLVPPDIGVPWLRHYMQGYRTRELAARNYKPKVYTDHITLFRASDIDPEAGATLRQTGVDFANPTFGWSDLCTEPIEVHTVPGYHETIVLEPNVQILAEKFKACLSAALTETVST